jgi:DNA polymerase-3 subunit alpha
MAGKYDEAKRPPGSSRRCSARGTSFSRCRTTAEARTRSLRRDVQDGADLDIPLIATNDSALHRGPTTRGRTRFCCACRRPGSMNDPKRFKFDTQEFYIKTAEEMPDVSRSIPRCAADDAVSERCNLKLKQGRQSVSGVSGAEGMRRSTATSSRSAAKGCRSGWRRRCASCGAWAAAKTIDGL